jgi:hypothetical protein
MLTLDQAIPVAAEEENAKEPGGSGAHSGRRLGVPMACESLVADAVCHLLTGFFMIEKLSVQPHRDGTDFLDWASENICVVLESLDECSNAFWSSQKRRGPMLSRSNDVPRARKGRRREREDPPESDVGAREPLRPPGAASGQTPTTQGPSNNSGEDKALSSSLLQLVGAYRAMDALSVTPFRCSAPFAFELACHCLCTAIVALEECSLEVEGCGLGRR